MRSSKPCGEITGIVLVLSLALASKAFDSEICIFSVLGFQSQKEKANKARQLQLRPQVDILHMINNGKKNPKIHENEKHGAGEGSEGQKLD